MFSSIAIGLSLAAAASAVGISVTPHDKYSSSVGVLGCHINTNRVAYFPEFPSCGSVCVEVSANGRTVHLLHIDQSGGAYDISYDAWNYLVTGQSAAENPTMGGGIPAEYTRVGMDKCQDLIKTPSGKLPLMAANSIGYYVGCGENSWIGQNSALYNIQNCACTFGFNEVCHLDLAVSNQPSCPHLLGSTNRLSGLPVTDIAYGTGVETAQIQ
ncbi:uncharacterized protein EI97DRAFT_211530 [Westerdykella ornata]|uniref:Cerato-platanin n=1 Tax=Westerdykella ornata TaxID=318751 RepID=A0A6A6J6Y7_WESOR|nr:uncharacterized protein EI97DRAFT_211530 [Westerdykella ornata]KAF2272341.1 hypothetical protein EI97DRAFT_211530 [Westerdykella ornata]